MKLNTVIYLLLWMLTPSYLLQAQGMNEQHKSTMEWLDSKKTEFQNTTNDSLFVSQNSDSPYRFIYLSRGDEPEDVEDEIFGAKVGKVIGPFRAEQHNYLFKVIGLDSIRNRIRISHLFIKPKGTLITDTADAMMLGQKIVKSLNKGGDFQAALKEFGSDYKKIASNIGLHEQSDAQSTDGDVGWVWEGTLSEPINKSLVKTEKGMSTLALTKYGVHVFKVVDKQKGFYKAKIITLVKNIE